MNQPANKCLNINLNKLLNKLSNKQVNKHMALAVFLWLFTRLMLLALFSDWQPADDVSIYFDYASAFWSGQMPYADYQMEYPPGALILFLMPGYLASDYITYNPFFVLTLVAVEGLMLWLVTAVLKYKGQGEKTGVALLTILVMHTFLAMVTFRRFDLLPSVFTVLALLGCYKNNRGLAWVSLGLAFAIKLYPLVLMPLVLLYFVRLSPKKRIKEAAKECVWGAGWLGVSVALVWGPFAWLAGGKMFGFLRYHGDRGIQVESLYANMLEIFNSWSGVAVKFNYGAWHLQSPLADQMASSSLWLMAAAFAGIYVLIYKRVMHWTHQQFRQHLPELFLLVLVTFVLTGKVFSPQFILWVTPFIVLAGTGLNQTKTYWILGLGISLLTGLIWPAFYKALIQLETIAVLLLSARNLLLVICFVYLIRKGLLKSPAKNTSET